ncbi:MAG: hypothetical protein FWG28_01010 [Clostridiales bacterium]|nr:hypothetical protein [Clostridiales bacterium]
MDDLGHSYSVILKGDDGESLLAEARRMASALVCRETEPARRPCGSCPGCRQVAAGAYPYLFEIAPQGAANRIRISQIRELQAMLASKAGEGQARVAVFLDAHRMGEESQNCLLKTLEEPPPDTLLLLLTGKPEELLPTVRSRCQVIDLGSAGRAPDVSDRELVIDVLKDVAARGYAAVFDKALFVEESRKKAAPAFLGAFEYLMRNATVAAMGGPAGKEAYRLTADGETFLKALKHIWKAGYLLERNVNPLLVLENLFLQIKKLNIRVEERD